MLASVRMTKFFRFASGERRGGGGYYSVAVTRIRPYSGYGIQLPQKISAVYGFRIATRLRKIGI